jgi:hypothetical protein
MKKSRSYAKLCLCDRLLRAAWLQETISLEQSTRLDAQPHLNDLPRC